MPSRLYVRLAAAAGAAVLAVTAAPAAAADLPSGPDVSRWQHPADAPIDWAAVKAAGQSFAFVKATEGTTYTNPYFAGDWEAARAAGLYRGAYHYARPDAGLGDAFAEAGYFASVIGAIDAPGDLPPVLDLESDGGLAPAALAQWTDTFLTTVAAATGRTPIIYTFPTFWANRMGGSAAFTDYPLWIGHHDVATPRITPWSRWTFWQHTATASVTGIATVANTDLNRFNGTAAELARLALVPVGPTLSLSGPKTAVRYGSSATVTGKLLSGDGSPAPAAQVELYRRLAGQSTETLLATLTTGADGTYRHTFPARVGTALTARSAATTEDQAVASPAVSIRVAAAVQAQWSDGTVRDGTLATVRGAVRPYLAGTLITRQVWDGERWTRVAQVRAGSDGRFTFTVKARAGAQRTHRVVAAPAGYASGSAVLPKLRVS